MSAIAGQDRGPDGWLLAVLGSVAGAALVVWGGAVLAATLTGGHLSGVTLGIAVQALLRLPSHAGRPAAAWPAATVSGLPGPIVYWAATGLVATVAGIAGWLGWRWSRGWRDRGRVRLGVETRARFASTADLATLIVTDPVPAGRFVLGRVNGKLVATEDATNARVKTRRNSVRARQGDRGSVAVIGPARSGKSANAAAGIRGFRGPAIIVSVRRDLLDATVPVRRQLGHVKVFDPAQQTKITNPAELARWSPLRPAATASGAQKAAAALAAAIPRSGVDGGTDYWVAQAEILLAGLIATAGLDAKVSMEQVARWVFTKDMPGVNGRPSAVFALIKDAAGREGEVAERASWAMTQLDAIWRLDERVRSSVYATVQTAVAPWTDPTVAASAAPFNVETGEKHTFVDLDWLDAGENTLYLVAPLNDQKRLAPVLGGLLGDLKDQAYGWEVANRRLARPLLMVIDEAGNMPLAWLPEVASTCAGIGIVLVTIWQSKAQLDAAYGRLADSVLTNHLTKIVFAGASDTATLDYVSRLLGEEDVSSRSTSFDVGGGGRRSVSESTHREALAPFHLLRQVQPGGAVLIHGTLPPAYLQGRRWWQEPAPTFPDRAAAPADRVDGDGSAADGTGNGTAGGTAGGTGPVDGTGMTRCLPEGAP